MFKGLKLLKTSGKGRLNNLNDPVLNVLRLKWLTLIKIIGRKFLLMYNYVHLCTIYVQLVCQLHRRILKNEDKISGKELEDTEQKEI